MSRPPQSSGYADWTAPVVSGSSPDAPTPPPIKSHRKSGKKSDEKSQLEPAPSALIPLGGWRRLVYRWYRWRNVPNPKNPKFLKVPKPSKKQQAEWDAIYAMHWEQAHRENKAFDDDKEWQRRDRVAQESHYRLRELTDITKRGTIAFINSKGAAGVTTTAVNMMCVLGWETQVITIMLDVNPAEGTSAARLGKDHNQTITVQELSERLDELAQFDQFISEVRPNRYFVRSISANSVVEGRNPLLEADQLSKIVPATKKNCEFLGIDTANVLTDPATLAVLQNVDVFVFPANVDVHDSLRQLATSMQSLRVNGFKDKVENSVVIITNLPANDHKDNYRKFLNRTNFSDEVIEVWDKDFKGAFLGVHHDPVIKRDSIVDLDAWDWQVRQDYREACIAVLQQLEKVQNPQMTHQTVRQIGLAKPQSEASAPVLPPQMRGVTS